MNPLYADSEKTGHGNTLTSFQLTSERQPSPPRPRAGSTEKTILVGDTDGYSAVNPFETDADGEIALHYNKIQGLQEKHKVALQKMDIDGNGTVSLSEMLTMEKSNRSLKQTVCYLAVALLLLIVTLFAVSWGAAILAQNTKVNGSAMTAAGTKDIVTTAAAQEAVPAAYASLLSPEALGRVKEITVSTLTEVSDDLPDIGSAGATTSSNSTSIKTPSKLMAQVQFVQYFNETYVEFACMGGVTISMDHGEIRVTGLPQSPQTKFVACGSASCSSIKVEDVDVATLDRRASELGFADADGGDDHLRRTSSPHLVVPHLRFVDADTGDDAVRRNAMRRSAGGCSASRCLNGAQCFIMGGMVASYPWTATIGLGPPNAGCTPNGATWSMQSICPSGGQQCDAGSYSNYYMCFNTPHNTQHSNCRVGATCQIKGGYVGTAVVTLTNGNTCDRAGTAVWQGRALCAPGGRCNPGFHGYKCWNA